MTLKSSKHNPDAIRYLVICDDKGQRYVPQRNLDDMGRAATVLDIAQGQLDNMVQVVELNTAELSSRDVTEDIARSVLRFWIDDGEPLTSKQRDFVELHLDIQAPLSPLTQDQTFDHMRALFRNEVF